jgi:hypothetical protein
MSSKRSATGTRTLVEPRRLLAAMSLLGASLGVSVAAPADGIAGSERAAKPADAAVTLAETKSLKKGGTAGGSRSMGWDVRPSQRNQYKSDQKKGVLKSDQKKGTLPAAQ